MKKHIILSSNNTYSIIMYRGQHVMKKERAVNVRIPNGTACGIRTAPFIQQGCRVGERTNERGQIPPSSSPCQFSCASCNSPPMPLQSLPPSPWRLLTVFVVRALICRSRAAVSKVGGVGIINSAAFVLSIRRRGRYSLGGVGVIDWAALGLSIGWRWRYRLGGVRVIGWAVSGR